MVFSRNIRRNGPRLLVLEALKCSSVANSAVRVANNYGIDSSKRMLSPDLLE
jgi:hypothetical protein